MGLADARTVNAIPIVALFSGSLASVALAGVGCSGGAADDGNTRTPDVGTEAGIRDSRTDAGVSRSTDAGFHASNDVAVPPSTDGSGPIAATMNDVSILFPLPASQGDLDKLLPPSASGDLGALLPSSLYASIGFISGSTFPDGGPPDGSVNSEVAAYASLRVVSMRIDPCFASLDPDPHGAGCTAQIRLVFEEVDWGNGATAFDSALHAFYDLTRGEFLALAGALVDLRIANENADAETAGPLGPHPILVRQGLGGPMSTGVKRLILQYAGERNLVRLAQLSGVPSGLGGTWTMAAFDVAEGASTATRRTIPTLGDAASVVPQFVETDFGGGAGHGAGTGSGSGMGLFEAELDSTTASAAEYISLDDGNPMALSAEARQAAFDALVRVENPAENSANTIDCARCHLATPTEQLIAMPLFSLVDTLSPLAFAPDGTHVTQADLAPSFQNAPGNLGPVNIHAISQRTANETAAIVAYLNGLPQ